MEYLLIKNMRHMKTKFGIDDALIENHRLPIIYWTSELHKAPVKCDIKKLQKRKEKKKSKILIQLVFITM